MKLLSLEYIQCMSCSLESTSLSPCILCFLIYLFVVNLLNADDQKTQQQESSAATEHREPDP